MLLIVLFGVAALQRGVKGPGGGAGGTGGAGGEGGRGAPQPSTRPGVQPLVMWLLLPPPHTLPEDV